MARVVFCPKCGASAPEGTAQCRLCGRALDVVAGISNMPDRPWFSIWLHPRDTIRTITARSNP